MVQINLKKEIYDEAVRQGKNIPEWINSIAQDDLKRTRTVKTIITDDDAEIIEHAKVI